MNILVISQYYAPDITAAAFRISETVELMRLAGHDVRVVTAFPHKSEVSVNEEADRRMGVVRVPVAPIGGGGASRYLNHYLSFMRRSAIAGLKQRLGSWCPAIIWASSPPLFTGLTGRLLSIIYNCPLVFDVRDIWPEFAVSAGQISPTGRAYQVGRILERVLYNSAHHITCVSKAMADYIGSRTRNSNQRYLQWCATAFPFDSF